MGRGINMKKMKFLRVLLVAIILVALVIPVFYCIPVYAADPIVIDKQVAASADDVGVYWDGATWVITDLDLIRYYTGYVDSTLYKSGNGLRFTGVTIPAGAVITSAYISVYSNLNLSNNTVKSYITGNKENNPATFSTLADYQSRRGTVVGGANDTKITTAQVAWDTIPSWTGGTWYNSPDIKTVIQELVTAYAPTNEAISLFWDDHDNRSTNADGVYRRGAAYDTFGNISGAKLHIEYKTSPTVTTQAVTSITNTTATGNGNITSNGGDVISEKGICYSSSTNPPTTADSTAHDHTDSTGAFTESLVGLTHRTLYYARAYAINSVGTSYGSTVTFTTIGNPAIDTVAASNIAVTTARLNSQITSDGGATSACQVSFGYGTTELLNVGTLANDSGTATGAPISLSGGFDEVRTATVVITGAGTFNITLPAGVTGVATSGIATLAGSPVALAAGATTAIDSGATTGNITVAITNVYDTITAFAGTYSTNDFPYADITGLTGSTAYYFRVQVKNIDATVTSATERTFTTYATPTVPTSLQASPLSTSISLSWTKGVGSNKTLIRYRLDTYPTTTADGTQLYLDTGTTYTHTGLALGTTYYYSLWGENVGTYSTTSSPVSIAMTTTAEGVTSTGFDSMTNPTDYDLTSAEVDTKVGGLSNLEPFYSLTNNFVDSWGMARGNAWAGIFAFIIVILSLIVYIKSGSISGALIVMLVGLILGYFIGIVSGWWILFGLCGVLGSFALPKREA